MPKSTEIPDCPGVPEVRSSRWQTQEYDIKLITPLFGGGVLPRVNDPSFPIRPTAIRGQLQFWWRATVGAQYETVEDLRAAQSAIWGDTTRPSLVQIRVEDVRATKPRACARYEKDREKPNKYRSTPSWEQPFNNTALPYALFPFQGQLNKDRSKIEIFPASFIETIEFRLIVVWHKDIDFATEIEPALWAWVNFGGLGSRTRRGCGAVCCERFAPADKDDLRKMWCHYMPTLFPKREWPTLAEAILIHDDQSDSATSAWHRVIDGFRHFRQGVEMARNAGQEKNRPGRSRWPEPDTIRRITKQWKWSHKPDDQMPDAFPRAEFGLPIVFHFKDNADRVGDPPDTVLYPDNDSEGKKRERMASPLILKPLALKSGKYVPLILRLKTYPLTGVDLRRGETSLSLAPTTVIRDPRLTGYRNSPLANSPNGSAIEAFLAHAKSSESRGFTEVTR